MPGRIKQAASGAEPETAGDGAGSAETERRNGTGSGRNYS